MERRAAHQRIVALKRSKKNQNNNTQICGDVTGPRIPANRDRYFVPMISGATQSTGRDEAGRSAGWEPKTQQRSEHVP